MSPDVPSGIATSDPRSTFAQLTGSSWLGLPPHHDAGQALSQEACRAKDVENLDRRRKAAARMQVDDEAAKRRLALWRDERHGDSGCREQEHERQAQDSPDVMEVEYAEPPS